MNKTIMSAIKASKGVVLGAHTNPDGDAIGALVGMATLCGFLHIPYTILLEKVPEAFKTLLESMVVSDEPMSLFDTFISVDCGDEERLGVFATYFKAAQTTINIDHHITNTHFAQYNEVDGEASSSCEVVYRFIEASGCPISTHLAEALYTGLITDTGGFMHSCTHPSTHRVVAQLLEVPFNHTKLYYEMLCEKSEAAAYMEALALTHLKKCMGSGAYLAYVTAEEMKQHDATKEDLGTVVTYIKSIKGCELAIFIYPLEEETYKVSFRSNPPYDVASLAQSFGGGGHVRAAGATLYGSLEEVIDKIEMALHF